MKIVSVSHPRDYNFTVGRTIVTFNAEDIEGQQRSCSVLIDVFGKFSLAFEFKRVLLLLLIRLTQLLLLHDTFHNIAPVCSISCQFN